MKFWSAKYVFNFHLMEWKVDELKSKKIITKVLIDYEYEYEEDYLEFDFEHNGPIILQFMLMPKQLLANFSDQSIFFRNADPLVINFLKQKNFFDFFAQFLTTLETIPEKCATLKIIDNLCQISSDQIILELFDHGCYLFLKKEMFTECSEERYMVLQCLIRFSMVSDVKKLMFILSFLTDIYSVIFGSKDEITIQYTGEIIANILSDDIENEDFTILRSIGLKLLDYEVSFKSACRVLCSFSMYEKMEDPEFSKPEIAEKLVHCLSVVLTYEDNSILYLMKFFTVRSNFIKEATAFYNATIFEVLAHILSLNNDTKTKWVGYIFDNIIKNVPNSTIQFLNSELVGIYISFAINSSYIVKETSLIVLSKVVRNCVNFGFNKTQFEPFYPVIEIGLGMLDSNERVLFCILDLIIAIISLDGIPEPLIEYFCDVNTCESLNNLTNHSVERIRDMAFQILRMIQELTPET
ncbi:hypothetical protein TRFO_34214 [Tritrichomonas foetus]|uniref:Uncharacterized protein n=1 Tax=Tritrichomonas foetus TaxID=1144522 RepID=A0A1J4JJL5_9EUKA|nr:hypothetical protein TRFO_34214 [Tritrichomonas foetus]|eukprot:OHS99358.1 hypothetical protein TRFO_34214 [Tritrichomonas foetus]